MTRTASGGGVGPAPRGRHDLYAAVHKGLRLGHARLLERLGCVDWDDDEAVAAVAAELRRAIALGRKHLASENAHIHRALEARVPTATETVAAEHEEHEASFAALERGLQAVEAAAGDRAALGRALYLRYSEFAGDDLLHMAEEELRLLPVLQMAFDDEELRAIEGRIVAGIPPDLMMDYLRLMVPAIAPPERVTLLSGVRLGAPPEAFAAILDQAVRPSLTGADWDRLVSALG